MQYISKYITLHVIRAASKDDILLIHVATLLQLTKQSDSTEKVISICLKHTEINRAMTQKKQHSSQVRK